MPAASWMAPSTPPPPRSDALAAFTMASTAWVVMSPSTGLDVRPLAHGLTVERTGAAVSAGEAPAGRSREQQCTADQEEEAEGDEPLSSWPV